MTDRATHSRSCCWKFHFSFKVAADLVAGLLFVLFLHAASVWPGSLVCLQAPFIFFLFVSLLPFATSNYCNRMALRNKKPRFPPTPGKYLAIVLEENNKKTYQDSENSTQSASPPSQRHPSMQMWNTVHCWESRRVCYRFTYVFCQSEDNSGCSWSFLSFQQGLVGGSYGDK